MKLLVETISGEKLSIPISSSDDLGSIRYKIVRGLQRQREKQLPPNSTPKSARGRALAYSRSLSRRGSSVSIATDLQSMTSRGSRSRRTSVSSIYSRRSDLDELALDQQEPQLARRAIQAKKKAQKKKTKTRAAQKQKQKGTSVSVPVPVRAGNSTTSRSSIRKKPPKLMVNRLTSPIPSPRRTKTPGSGSVWRKNQKGKTTSRQHSLGINRPAVRPTSARARMVSTISRSPTQKRNHKQQIWNKRSPPRSARHHKAASPKPKINNWAGILGPDSGSSSNSNPVSSRSSGRFVTSFHVPRNDQLKAEAHRYESNDRGPYIGNVEKCYVSRPTMEARHLRMLGKTDFNTKFKVPSSPEVGINGEKAVVLSASERTEKEKGTPTKNLLSSTTTRPLANRPWFEEENPGMYNQPVHNGADFRTAFHTPRPDDLRVEAHRKLANDRGPYIGDLKDIPPSELSLRIEAAETLRSSSFGTGDTHLNLSSIIDKQTRVNKNKFNVYFHVPDTSRGIDGEVTEPLSASDRRVKGQESTSRSEAPLETEDHIWNITSPLSPHYGPHEPIQTAW